MWGFWKKFAGWYTIHGYGQGYGPDPTHSPNQCSTCERVKKFAILFYKGKMATTSGQGKPLDLDNEYDRGLILRTGLVLDKLEWEKL